MNIKETLEDLATAAYCGVSTLEELKDFREAVADSAKRLPITEIRVHLALRKVLGVLDEDIATHSRMEVEYVDNGLLANKIRLIGNVFGSRFK